MLIFIISLFFYYLLKLMSTQSEDEEFNIITLIPCEFESDEENEINNSQDSIDSSDLVDSSDCEKIFSKEVKPLIKIIKTDGKNIIVAKSIQIID